MSRYVRVLMIGTVIAYSTFVFPLHNPLCAHADDKTNTEKWGDVIHVALPVFAFGSTFFAGSPDGKKWDKEGTAQSLKSIGTGVVLTAFGKESIHKMRPNESNNRSFPSGHTSFAFSGAGFIDTRYGHKWGIPSLLAAAFVGYSRVYADAHFADDALAGASVGLLSSWLFTTPQTESGSVAILPMVQEGGTGLQLTMTNGGINRGSATQPPSTSSPRFRFNFGFGPAFLDTNEITAPSDRGTTFDLNNFNKDENPSATAAVGFDIFLNEKDELHLFYAPYENRDRGTFTSPVLFAGQIFPANRTMRSAWRLHDLRARWRHNLTPSKRWDVKLGGGLFYQDTTIELAAEDGSVAAEARDQVLLPYVHGSLGYQIAPKWSVALEADGISLSEDSMLDAVVYLNYKISKRWDFSIGYEYYARDIETSELTNKVVYHVPYLAVSFSWLK